MNRSEIKIDLRRWALFILIAAILVLTQCSKSEVDMLSWHEWANSGEAGVWCDQVENGNMYTLVATIAEEEISEPIVFNAGKLACQGVAMLITDVAQQCLICIDQNENILWRYGELGEGPSSFLRISDVVVFGEYIAVSDIQLGRVDVLTKSGECIVSLYMQYLQSTISHTDTSIVLMSGYHDLDNILEYNYNGELLNAITISTWENEDFAYLKGISSESGDIAVFTSMGDEFAIIENDWTGYDEFQLRDFPIEYPSIEYGNTEQGQNAARAVPFIGNVFIGEYGMINVRLMPITEDKQFWDFDDAVMAPVTVIERYSWEGEYLNSYIIPMKRCKYATCTNNGRIIAIDRDTAYIQVYERE